MKVLETTELEKVSGESAEKLTTFQSQNQEKLTSQNTPPSSRVSERAKGKKEEKGREDVERGEQIEVYEGSFEGETCVGGEAVKYGTICVPQTRKSDLSGEQEQEEERGRGGEDAWRRFQDDFQGEVGKLKEAGFLGLVSQEEKEEGIVLLSQVEAKSWVDGQSQQGAGEHRTQSYFVLN